MDGQTGGRMDGGMIWIIKWLLARLERCWGETTARVDEGKDGQLLSAWSVVGWTYVWGKS